MKILAGGDESFDPAPPTSSINALTAGVESQTNS